LPIGTPSWFLVRDEHEAIAPLSSEWSVATGNRFPSYAFPGDSEKKWQKMITFLARGGSTR
jgi:hypothetical protein